ncbi:Cytoskeletal signaling protein slm1 [Psilocybe cubensis]|uniref:Cytoskeletal signaling protein slm1 n=1 Tax=Psilocybe cubensis TaxID=181762 RepID=A0ACB8H2G6_PSICU|nr:Cytoskeletal signaling protein slm1 [Psilocybe cubensis]KAH9482026.1 Cytoskeletal signaling protein slm1 [Psilocybe cubensis]
MNNLDGPQNGTHIEPRASSLSRSASRASARSRTSSLSRTQSLIKKNIELQDLRPADVLIERFVAWKAIVKQLTAYFEGIADIENNTARELTKLAGVIQVPFRAGNQFLGGGGLQDVYYDIRDKTRVIADHHADLGRTIDSSIVQHLQKLRAEIKAHIKNVQNDTGKLAAGVARERELSTKLVGELANSISTFKNTPMNIHAKNDPYIANQLVSRQLSRQLLEENLLQKSLIITQQNSAHFEEGIVKSLQSAWATYDEWQSRAASSTQTQLRSLSTAMGALAPDREWISFAARSDHLLDPETPLRDMEVLKWPMKDEPCVAPVHTGHLERKKRFTRAYQEAYFVLTPAGSLFHPNSTALPIHSHGRSGPG